MHELSLAMSAVAIVGDAMARRPEAGLKEVEIEVGALSGVEPETFRTAMESVLASSGYGATALRLLLTPGRFECLGCGARFESDRRFAQCPQCGSGQCLATVGTEFRVTSLTLTEPEPVA